MSVSLTKTEATLYAVANVCIKELKLGNFLSAIDSIQPVRNFWSLRLKGITDTGTEVEFLTRMEFNCSGRNPYNFTDAAVHISHRKLLDGVFDGEFTGVAMEVVYSPEHGIIIKTQVGAQS